MEQHLRAALAECDARLTSLAAETQQLLDQRGYILRALQPVDGEPASDVKPSTPSTPPLNRSKYLRSPRACAGTHDDLRIDDLPSDAEARVLKVLAVAADAGTVLDFARLCRYTGINRSTLKQHLHRLVRDGRVHATGATVSRRYQLPTQRGSSQAPAGASEGD